MSFIEINPDVKLLVKELRRIAVAIEQYLQLEYGFRMTEPTAKELKGEEADVSYSDDLSTLKNEIEQARSGKSEEDEDVLDNFR